MNKYYGQNVQVRVGQNSIDPNGPSPKIVRAWTSSFDLRTNVDTTVTDSSDTVYSRELKTGATEAEVYFKDELSGDEIAWAEMQVAHGALKKAKLIKHPLDTGENWARTVHPYDIFESSGEVHSANPNSYSTPIPLWLGLENYRPSNNNSHFPEQEQKVKQDFCVYFDDDPRKNTLSSLLMTDDKLITRPTNNQGVDQRAGTNFDTVNNDVNIDGSRYGIKQENGQNAGQVNLTLEQFQKLRLLDPGTVFQASLSSTLRTGNFLFVNDKFELTDEEWVELDNLKILISEAKTALREIIDGFDRETFDADWDQTEADLIEARDADCPPDPDDPDEIALCTLRTEAESEQTSLNNELDGHINQVEDQQNVIADLEKQLYEILLKAGLRPSFPRTLWRSQGLSFYDENNTYDPIISTPNGSVTDENGNVDGQSASPGGQVEEGIWPKALSYSDFPSHEATSKGGANTAKLHKINEFNITDVVHAHYQLGGGWMRFAGFNYGVFPFEHGGGIPFWQMVDTSLNFKMPEWNSEGFQIQLHDEIPTLTRWGEYGPLCVNGGVGVSAKCVSYPQRISGQRTDVNFIDLNEFKVADFIVAPYDGYWDHIDNLLGYLPGGISIASSAELLQFDSQETLEQDGSIWAGYDQSLREQYNTDWTGSFNYDDPNDPAFNYILSNLNSFYNELTWDIFFLQPNMMHDAYIVPTDEAVMLDSPFATPDPPRNLGINKIPNPPTNLKELFRPDKPQSLILSVGETVPDKPRNIQLTKEELEVEVLNVSDQTIECNGSIDLSSVEVKLSGESVSSSDYSVNISPPTEQWNSTNGSNAVSITFTTNLEKPSPPILTSITSLINKPDRPWNLRKPLARPDSPRFLEETIVSSEAQTTVPTDSAYPLTSTLGIVSNVFASQHTIDLVSNSTWSNYRFDLKTEGNKTMALVKDNTSSPYRLKVSGQNSAGSAGIGHYTLEMFASSFTSSGWLEGTYDELAERQKIYPRYDDQVRIDGGYNFSDIVSLPPGYGANKIAIANNPGQNPVTASLDILTTCKNDWNQSMPESWNSCNYKYAPLETIQNSEGSIWNDVVKDEYYLNISRGNSERQYFGEEVSEIELTERNSYLIIEGEIWGRGCNTYSQFGFSTAYDIYYKWLKLDLNTANPITYISAHDNYVLYVDSVGDLYGQGSYNLNPISSNQLNSGVDKVYTKNFNTYVLKTDGTVHKADGNALDSWTQIATNVVDVSIGAYHALFLKDDKKVYSFGSNDQGQRGIGSTDEVSELTDVGLSNIHSISAGSFHSVALDEYGSLFVWGYNSHGQLGYNGSNSSSVIGGIIDSPHRRLERSYSFGDSSNLNSQSKGPKVVSVMTGRSNTFYVTEDIARGDSRGTFRLWGMGSNLYGEFTKNLVQTSVNGVTTYQNVIPGPVEIQEIIV